jgi:NodT family efflux transporter outer membrane factor (OMF) lipoprotein
MNALPVLPARPGWLVLLPALCLLLGGCATVGPDYETPAVDIEDQWQEAEDPALTPETQDDSDWWAVFGDPVLDELVEQAYAQNLTLRAAAVRILEARAQLGIAVGNLYPQQQQASGGIDYQDRSSNDSGTAFGDLSFTRADIGLDLAWEPDVWGRLRNDIRSADAGYLASIASYDDVLVSLVAGVADAYTLIRTFQKRIEIAKDNVGIQERSIEIADVRFRNETTTELDVQQAKSLLASTQATIPGLETGLRQARNGLSILLGVAPGGLPEGMGAAASIPAAPAEVAVGVPADLVRRRPIVRRAELQAAAQAAQVGVAKAELYPRFALGGSIGLVTSEGSTTTLNGESDFGDLFNSDSTFTGGGATFTWPLFNYGQLKNQVRVQDARYQQLLVDYQDTVLQAVRDAEDAMTAFVRSREEVGYRTEGEAASRRAVDLALTQYREGATDYTTVLNTQQSLLAAQEQLVNVRGEVARNLVALYKALGGGWEIREGRPLLSEETEEEMRERTRWGRLTSPDMDRELVPPEETPLRPDW